MAAYDSVVPSPDEYSPLAFRELADLVAARTPAPGGGSVAALVLTLAAGLVTMAARFSDRHWEGARAVVERSEALRAEAAPLAGEDAAAYALVLEAGRAAAGDEAARRQRIEEAKGHAAEVPLRIGQLAAEVAELGASVVKNGNPNLEGDAAAGALLAASAAQIASRLVELNLRDVDPTDDRIERARAFAAAGDAAARSAAVRP
jgi:formiminotetrahydrofolate cyclodeaminase